MDRAYRAATWDMQPPHLVIVACFGNILPHICPPHHLHAFHLTQQSSLLAMRRDAKSAIDGCS